MTAPRKKPESKRARELAAAQAEVHAAQRKLAALQERVLPGRPTAYKPEFAARATGLALLGLTNAEMGERFGVDEKTIEGWLRDVPEFSGAVYDGREGIDIEVVAAMAKAARGYEHPEDDIRTVSIGDGMSEIRITPTTKRYPPNYNFANLWLANRQRRRWPHRESLDVAGITPGGGGGEDAIRAARAAIKAALDDSAPAPSTDDEGGS